jgi:hypothetical protein
MAINWSIKISQVNPLSGRAYVNFKRLDDVTGAEEIYGFSHAMVGTPEYKASLLDTVWQMHLDTVNKQTAADEFIGDFEQSGKSDLDAREV